MTTSPELPNRHNDDGIFDPAFREIGEAGRHEQFVMGVASLLALLVGGSLGVLVGLVVTR